MIEHDPPLYNEYRFDLKEKEALRIWRSLLSSAEPESNATASFVLPIAIEGRDVNKYPNEIYSLKVRPTINNPCPRENYVPSIPDADVLALIEQNNNQAKRIAFLERQLSDRGPPQMLCETERSFLKCGCGPSSFTFFLSANPDGSLVGECASCRKVTLRTGSLTWPKGVGV